MVDLKIAVVGAGGWGTALAIVLSKKQAIKLWCFEPDIADEIGINHTNSDFLPGIELPTNIVPFTDINKLLEADIIINTVPTQHIRTTYANCNFPFENKIVINCSKGIEKGTLQRIFEVFEEVVNLKPQQYVVLSGPSHAEEVARNIPTAVIAASRNFELSRKIAELFTLDSFRVYTSPDVIGCELGGALKNVIAIATGISDGLGTCGDNSKAALVTRGLSEIARLGEAMGANTHTFSGLSGLGDLVVTCGSKHSRNMRAGFQLGQGKSLSDILHSQKSIPEGVDTTISAYMLAKKLGVEMPITEQVYNVLYKGQPVELVVDYLMLREIKNEL